MKGYRREKGVCEKGIKDCRVYDAEGKCDECDPYFSLILNECRPDWHLGCKIKNRVHECLECW